LFKVTDLRMREESPRFTTGRAAQQHAAFKVSSAELGIVGFSSLIVAGRRCAAVAIVPRRRRAEGANAGRQSTRSASGLAASRCTRWSTGTGTSSPRGGPLLLLTGALVGRAAAETERWRTCVGAGSARPASSRARRVVVLLAPRAPELATAELDSGDKLLSAGGDLPGATFAARRIRGRTSWDPAVDESDPRTGAAFSRTTRRCRRRGDLYREAVFAWSRSLERGVGSRSATSIWGTAAWKAGGTTRSKPGSTTALGPAGDATRRARQGAHKGDSENWRLVATRDDHGFGPLSWGVFEIPSTGATIPLRVSGRAKAAAGPPQVKRARTHMAARLVVARRVI